MSSGASNSTSRQGRQSPVRAKRRIEAARGYLTLGMAEHALSELQYTPSTPHYRIEKFRVQGEAFCSLERYCDAIAVYTRALAERPDVLPILMGIAHCYHQKKRLDQAIAAMEEANRFHPNEPAVLVALARYYVVAGETQRAFSWLGRALRICPEIADIVRDDPDFAEILLDSHVRRLLEVAQLRRVR